MKGKRLAQFTLLVGIGISIYGNVQHTLVASKREGAIIFAIAWPVLVYLSIELMARVDWPKGGKWSAARFGGLGIVALVAAIASYRHLSGLLVYYGEDPIVATLGPLAPDGIMVLATTALLALGLDRSSQSAAEALPELAEGAGVAPVPQARRKAPRAVQVATRDGQRQRNEEARQAYRDSVATDTPLTGKELGDRYGKSRRWGSWIASTARQES